MFLETLPVRKMRTCLHCREYFDSSGAAERVCPKCRRKHNKLLRRHGNVITLESTPQMDSYLKKLKEKEDIHDMLTFDQIDAFLSGDDSVDDSVVYTIIKKEKTASKPTLDAVSILEAVMEKMDEITRKPKKVGVCLW